MTVWMWENDTSANAVRVENLCDYKFEAEYHAQNHTCLSS